jgi:HD-GYP domain-containing protein (c-di-GMP phosphodiesterase class II)
VLAIASAYYAMTSPRPYRDSQPFSHQETLQALQKEAGSKWDPMLVETLAKIPVDSLVI